MLYKWFMFALVIELSRGQSNEVCSLCKCTNNIVDCSARLISELSHFNSSIWTGKSFEKVLYDENNIIHLRPLPAFETTYLSLRNNKIAKIEDKAFELVKNLTILDLSENYLTFDNFRSQIFIGNYSPESYMPLESLRELRLSDNALHSLPEDTFRNLPNLEILLLDSNPFRTIDSITLVAIGTRPSIKVLDLSSTMLNDLPSSMFHPLRNLRVLNISNNQFTTIPPALGELHLLEEVVLDNNPIEEIKSVPSLPNLKVLRMNNMPSLRAIKDHSLVSLTQLEELHCSFNKYLVEISSSSMWSDASSPAEGQVWPPLKKLYISSNNIKSLGHDLVLHWENLESLDFQKNPIRCDCDNQWIVSTLLPIIESKNLSHTAGLICREPSEMEGMSLKSLSEKKYQMRCLDIYGHRPERDATVLIGIFIGILVSVPVTLIAVFFYRRRLHTDFGYSRAFYRKTPSRESFSQY